MAEDRDANVYIVEAVEMSSDTDTEDLMDDVADLDALGESVKDASHLDNLMESTHKKSQKQANSGEDSKKKVEPKHVQRLEVIDDFIRNFLSKNSMTKTLNCFQVSVRQYRNNGTITFTTARAKQRTCRMPTRRTRC